MITQIILLMKKTVNGNKQTVKVPFAAVTALVLDDRFSNVEEQGKVPERGLSDSFLGWACLRFIGTS